jgi:hypothetical protein
MLDRMRRYATTATGATAATTTVSKRRDLRAIP